MSATVSFSHIGITVPDLEKAVDFYTKALGLYLIMEPTEIERDDSAIGVMCDDVFGDKWTKFRIAHMSTNDRIGIELFEFPNTEPEEKPFESPGDFVNPTFQCICLQVRSVNEHRPLAVIAGDGKTDILPFRWNSIRRLIQAGKKRLCLHPIAIASPDQL